MKIGDSFYAKTTRGKLYSIAAYYKSRHDKNFLFVIRRESIGVRLWRIDKRTKYQIAYKTIKD